MGTDEDIKNLSERDCNTLRDYDIPIYAEMIGMNKIIVSNLKHYLDPKTHGRWWRNIYVVTRWSIFDPKLEGNFA